MTDTEFAGSYPAIWDFLETVIRPDVDGYNLFEMLHRVLARAHHDRAEQLVAEFERLAADEGVSPADLERVFGAELESPYRLVREENARDVLYTLAEYFRYLWSDGLGRKVLPVAEEP